MRLQSIGLGAALPAPANAASASAAANAYLQFWGSISIGASCMNAWSLMERLSRRSVCASAHRKNLLAGVEGLDHLVGRSMRGLAGIIRRGARALPRSAGAAQAAPKPMDCSRIDWYRLGERDAEMNSNRLGRYAARCTSGAVDAERYAEGQTRGQWVRQKDHWLYTRRPEPWPATEPVGAGAAALRHGRSRFAGRRPAGDGRGRA